MAISLDRIEPSTDSAQRVLGYVHDDLVRLGHDEEYIRRTADPHSKISIDRQFERMDESSDLYFDILEDDDPIGFTKLGGQRYEDFKPFVQAPEFLVRRSLHGISYAIGRTSVMSAGLHALAIRENDREAWIEEATRALELLKPIARGEGWRKIYAVVNDKDSNTTEALEWLKARKKASGLPETGSQLASYSLYQLSTKKSA